MRSVRSLIAAGAASLLSTAAFAADMPSIASPPPYYAPPPVQDFGGWYLRGDIGMTNTNGTLFSPENNAASTVSYQAVGEGFTSGTSFDVGVGYQFNSWFRTDVTGEYRSNVNFSGNQFSNINFGTGFGVLPFGDTYSAGYSSWVGLVNAYVDLGTWWCVTPFIGAGVGGAYNKTTGISDLSTFPGSLSAKIGVPLTGVYQAIGAEKWDLAWALYAGVAYKVTNNFTVELAYRYLDLGTAAFGNGSSFDGTNAGVSTFQFHDLTSQDIKIGVRWTCCDVEPAAPPPLIRKG
jgi:opacity protein-like surface antigen